MKLVRESLLEFHQTGDPLSSLNIGRYDGLDYLIFPELKEIVIFLKNNNYNFDPFNRHKTWINEYTDRANPYTYMGIPIEWGFSFWLDLKEPIKFYEKPRDTYFYTEYRYETALSLQKLSNGYFNLELSIYEIDDSHRNGLDLNKSFNILNLTTIPEIISALSEMLRKAEIKLKNRLTRLHKND